MRKLIVSNFATLDGYYEAKDKTIDPLFKYRHEDYDNDDSYDYYNAELLRAADILLLSGRTSFLGNKDYWTSVPNNPNATAIRLEFAQLIKSVEKIVVSDNITREELAPWDNTRIVKVTDAQKEVARIFQHRRRRFATCDTTDCWTKDIAIDLCELRHRGKVKAGIGRY